MSPESYVGVAIAAGRMTLTVQDGPDVEPVVALRDHALNVPDARGVVADLAQVVDDLFRREDSRTARPHGIGISIGGHISQDGRRVHFAPNLVMDGVNWPAEDDEEDLADVAEAALACPVVVENDVNCMAEHHRTHGRAVGKDNVLVVYLAPDIQGLGCGIIAGGSLIRGATGGAGELGHTVIQPDGPRCRCGNRGCLEAMLNVHNFNRDLNWSNASNGRGFERGAQLVLDDGDPGHARAVRVFRRGGRYLGQGLANVINLLNPQLILLGGPPELVASAPSEDSSAGLFMSSLRDALEDNTFSKMGGDCELVVAPLDLQVAAGGAALLARSRVDRDRLRVTEGNAPGEVG